jgi:hypothetical protein
MMIPAKRPTKADLEDLDRVELEFRVRGAIAGELPSQIGTGHAHCSKQLVMAAPPVFGRRFAFFLDAHGCTHSL